MKDKAKIRQLCEAVGYDDDKGVAEIVVIQAGLNSSGSVYYPEEVLQRDFGVFEGVKMFRDHPTEMESWEQPERSIDKWSAVLREVDYQDGKVVGKAHIIDKGLKEKIKALKESGALSEMGVSIRTSATVHDNREGDNLVVESLHREVDTSVDFVTYPGAGGSVLLYESHKQRQQQNGDNSMEVKELQQQIVELETKLTESERRCAELKEANDTATAKVQTMENSAALETVLTEEADLPDKAKDIVRKTLEESGSLDAAKAKIEEVKDLVASVTESYRQQHSDTTDNSNVTDMGRTGTAPEPDPYAEIMTKRYMREGDTLEQAKQKAALLQRR